MKLTLYIAEKRINNLMSAFDMCPSYKVFVHPVQQEIDRQGTDSDESFFHRIIESSRSQKDYWIPAVMHDGRIYVADGIKEISDGNRIMFVNREAKTA